MATVNSISFSGTSTVRDGEVIIDSLVAKLIENAAVFAKKALRQRAVFWQTVEANSTSGHQLVFLSRLESSFLSAASRAGGHWFNREADLSRTSLDDGLWLALVVCNQAYIIQLSH